MLQNNKEVKIYFNGFEADEIKKLISGRRKKLKAKFAQILTLKLKVKGIKCCLKGKHNWFSIKSKSPYWRGVYECVHKDCHIIYECFMTEPFSDGNGITVQVKFDRCCSHSDVPPKIQCSGEARNATAMAVVSKGVSATQAENFLKNREDSNGNVKFLIILIFLAKKRLLYNSKNHRPRTNEW